MHAEDQFEAINIERCKEELRFGINRYESTFVDNVTFIKWKHFAELVERHGEAAFEVINSVILGKIPKNITKEGRLIIAFGVVNKLTWSRRGNKKVKAVYSAFRERANKAIANRQRMSFDELTVIINALEREYYFGERKVET